MRAALIGTGVNRSFNCAGNFHRTRGKLSASLSPLQTLLSSHIDELFRLVLILEFRLSALSPVFARTFWGSPNPRPPSKTPVQIPLQNHLEDVISLSSLEAAPWQIPHDEKKKKGGEDTYFLTEQSFGVFDVLPPHCSSLKIFIFSLSTFSRA